LAAFILSFHTSLLHQGMVIVGLPYTFEGQKRIDELPGLCAGDLA
jgi:NAD(P)H dehydrogenase (quinone)